MQRSDTQSISINAQPGAVLDLIADVHRLPDWAPDFAISVYPDGKDWLISNGSGETRISVRVSSELSTVDFLAAGLPPEVEIGAFSRVVPNGGGSEFSFTQFFAKGLSDADAAHRKAVLADELRTVKSLCEGG